MGPLGFPCLFIQRAPIPFQVEIPSEALSSHGVQVNIQRSLHCLRHLLI